MNVLLSTHFNISGETKIKVSKPKKKITDKVKFAEKYIYEIKIEEQLSVDGL